MSILRPDPLALRGLVLAVSVLADLDLEPADDGVLLPSPHRTGDGPGGILVSWDTVAAVAAGHDPSGTVARRRLTSWLRLRILVARLGTEAPTVLRQAARALALPPGHAEHPGEDWVTEPLLGGALECGVAVVGLLDDPLEVLPLPADVAEAAGVDPRAWWPGVREHAESMGRLAVQRLRRDGGLGRDGAGRQQVLRPVGGVDVPTLLVGPVLRRYLADEDGSGMRALAVPMRSRGWFDLARIDPAFVGAAWSATEEHERGLPVPVLVTADEVGRAPHGGDVHEALSDPVVQDRWRRDVRYR